MIITTYLQAIETSDFLMLFFHEFSHMLYWWLKDEIADDQHICHRVVLSLQHSDTSSQHLIAISTTCISIFKKRLQILPCARLCQVYTLGCTEKEFRKKFRFCFFAMNNNCLSRQVANSRGCPITAVLGQSQEKTIVFLFSCHKFL